MGRSVLGGRNRRVNIFCFHPASMNVVSHFGGVTSRFRGVATPLRGIGVGPSKAISRGGRTRVTTARRTAGHLCSTYGCLFSNGFDRTFFNGVRPFSPMGKFFCYRGMLSTMNGCVSHRFSHRMDGIRGEMGHCARKCEAKGRGSNGG